LLPSHRQHKTIPSGKFLADVDTLLLAASEDEDTSWSFGPFSLDFELEESSNVLEYFLPVAGRAVDFEVVVGVDLFDLLDVEEVVLGVVSDVNGFVCGDVAVDDLLVGLILFPE
jgi:hypothetical protein